MANLLFDWFGITSFVMLKISCLVDSIAYVLFQVAAVGLGKSCAGGGKKDVVIFVSLQEHHTNLLPWYCKNCCKNT